MAASQPAAPGTGGGRRSKPVHYTSNKPHISELPITWGNWYQHVNWLSVFFIIVVPIMGFIAAYFYPLQRATGIFAVVYYFNTGLGITAGSYCLLPQDGNSAYLFGVNANSWFRISSSLGSFFI